MKYLKQFFLSSLVVLTVSCDNNDDNDDFNNNDFYDSTDVMAMENIAETDSWRVTRFIDDGVNETDDFAAYIFDF